MASKTRSVRRPRHNNNTKHHRNRESKIMTNSMKSKIVVVFMELLNMVKLYHWKTRSFAQHKATDELYAELNKNVDSFVEILLGKDESRVYLSSQTMRLVDHSDLSSFKKHIQVYRSYLISLNEVLSSRRDSDLLSVRDDILGNINQFIYLSTFDK